MQINVAVAINKVEEVTIDKVEVVTIDKVVINEGVVIDKVVNMKVKH